MVRALRIQCPDSHYHVTASSNEPGETFGEWRALDWTNRPGQLRTRAASCEQIVAALERAKGGVGFNWPSGTGIGAAMPRFARPDAPDGCAFCPASSTALQGRGRFVAAF